MHAAGWRRRRWVCAWSRRLKLGELAYLGCRACRRANEQQLERELGLSPPPPHVDAFLLHCRTIIAGSGGSSRTNDRSSRTICWADGSTSPTSRPSLTRRIPKVSQLVLSFFFFFFVLFTVFVHIYLRRREFNIIQGVYLLKFVKMFLKKKERESFE